MKQEKQGPGQSGQGKPGTVGPLRAPGGQE